jgi:DNA-binding NarL/FixJ family response regulator
MARAPAGRLQGRAPAPAPSRPQLTPRELDVLRLMTRGFDNVEIGASLYLARGTVKHHISNIYKKLRVENRVQAAVRAVHDGFVD